MQNNQEKEITKEEIREQCLFCQIADGKIPSLTLYQDDKILCFLDINPATLGHVLIIPKEHYAIFNQMPDELIEHVGIISKKVSLVLIKTLGAEGTNIFIANGAIAGQRAPHFILHVIPRFKNDALSETSVLNPKKNSMGQDKLSSLATKLKPEIIKILGNKSQIDKKNENKGDFKNILNDLNLSENHVVYSNEKYFSFVPNKSWGQGNLCLTTKKQNTIIEKVGDDDFGELFKIANKIMIALFETLNAQGTNLLIQNGTIAGQELNQFLINIIPRFENDGLNFQWTPQKISQEELKSTFESISTGTDLIFIDKRKKEIVLEDSKKEVIDLDVGSKKEYGEITSAKEKKEPIETNENKNIDEKDTKEKKDEGEIGKDRCNKEYKETKNLIQKGNNYLFEQLERLP